MNESGHRELLDSRGGQPVDFSPEIAALRLLGAGQFDPVRLHFLDVLARRASTHQGPARRLLDARLAQALAAFRVRFDQAQSDAPVVKAQITPPTSLGDLVRSMAQHAPGKANDSLDGSVSLRAELKSAQYFRNTWSKLSLNKQVTQALDQVPRNAGPINSHMLVLRSLALMREISPDYLDRFMSYADTLLSLEQGGKDKPVQAKKPAKAKAKVKLTPKPKTTPVDTGSAV